MPIIEVTDLVKRYNGLTAVNSISFEVKEGEFFGFLGPNGAGKTTTINILCTLLSQTSGRAEVNGYDCLKQPPQVRSSIGVVFQDITLDNDLTAYENLKFHCYLYNMDKRKAEERIESILNVVGLYDRKDDLVRKFSGGMKRRLEIARGLLHNPKVLFLDEAEVCDRIAIIDHGRIIACGTPDELKKMIRGDTVYLKTEDDSSAMVEMEKGFGIKVIKLQDGICFNVESGDKFIPKIFEGLTTAIVSVNLKKPTLDDVFMHLTGREIREENNHKPGELLKMRRRG